MVSQENQTIRISLASIQRLIDAARYAVQMYKVEPMYFIPRKKGFLSDHILASTLLTA